MATIKVKERVLTRPGITKRELTVLAVFLMGGDRKFVDTEDVAVKAAELAPTAFAWRKYPEQINLELVRAVLSDAKKKQFGALLHGTGTTGWRLSDAGVVWSQEKGRTFLDAAKSAVAPWAGSSDARRNDREQHRIRSTVAWAQWQSTGAIDLESAKLLFRIDDYATPEMRDQKVARLRSAVASDPQTTCFLEAAIVALKGT